MKTYECSDLVLMNAFYLETISPLSSLFIFYIYIHFAYTAHNMIESMQREKYRGTICVYLQPYFISYSTQKITLLIFLSGIKYRGEKLYLTDFMVLHLIHAV